MSSVFNRSEVDFTKQPMFFGEDQNDNDMINSNILYLIS